MSAKIIRITRSLPTVQIERPEPTTTLNLNRVWYRSSQFGFTLVEILIVLTIISVVMSLGLPAIERVTYIKLNSTTRKFVGIIRTIRNDAILLNKVHRLAIDMEKQRWWVESQKSFQLLSDKETKPDDKEAGGVEGKERPPTNFSYVDKYSKEPVPMPGGVVFQAVIKEREGKKTKGVAYVHFFPNGFSEQSILHLNKDGSQSKGYSLVVRPTSGRVELFSDFIEGFVAEK